MKNIEFINTMEINDLYSPKPASHFIPEWYKKTQSFIGNNKRDITYIGDTNSTIKKCQPVFDILTAGYIIPTYCDLTIKKTPEGNILYFTSQPNNITHHDIAQAPYHPNMNNHPYPKWTNPWGIKTPKGYSCLILPPVHSSNQFFTILEGFVDTDTYNAPINFPFVLNDIDFEGVVPAGTPMAQIIPIKREIWNNKITKNINDSNKSTNLLTSKAYNRYKTLFWNRKEYR